MKALTLVSIALSAVFGFQSVAIAGSLYRGSGRDVPPDTQTTTQSKVSQVPQCRRPEMQSSVPRCTLTTLPENRTSGRTYTPPDRGYPEGTVGSGTR